MWKPFYDRCSYFYLLYFSAQFQRFLHKLQHAKKFFFLFSLFFPYTKSSHFLIKHRALTAYWNIYRKLSLLTFMTILILALKNSTYDNFLKLSKKSIFTIEKKNFRTQSHLKFDYFCCLGSSLFFQLSNRIFHEKRAKIAFAV